MSLTASGFAATKDHLYVLRGDGAVFILIKAGDLVRGVPAEEPYWAACPAVPGTEAAKEQEG